MLKITPKQHWKIFTVAYSFHNTDFQCFSVTSGNTNNKHYTIQAISAAGFDKIVT